MKKIDLGQTISIFANLGVIAGLLFLAVEVRQNTETQRLSAAQQVLGLSYSNWTVQSADGAFSSLSAAIQSGQELTPEERHQYNLILRSIFVAFWQVHFQHEIGFLDREIFDAYERRVAGFINNPDVLEYWTSEKPAFGEGFQDWVDGMIDEQCAD